jgi:hypothetical protein
MFAHHQVYNFISRRHNLAVFFMLQISESNAVHKVDTTSVQDNLQGNFICGFSKSIYTGQHLLLDICRTFII